MVVTNGPLFSQRASGTQAGLLTHSTNKGRSYMKKKSIPTNNKQQKQLGVRAAMGWLAKEWSLLEPDERNSWQPPPGPNRLPPMTQYTSENICRILENKAPSKVRPVPGGPYNANVILWDFVSFHSHLNLGFLLSTLGAHWSAMIYRDASSGFTPNPTNLIRIVHPVDLPNKTRFDDTPPAKGTWYYRVAPGSATGTIKLSMFEFSAVWS